MIAKIFCFFGRCFYRMGSRLSPNNGVRQSTLGYDLTTGRLRSMAVPAEQSNNSNNRPVEQFTWNYLPGSDLKQSLAYPNGLTASWTYGNRGELLEVDNALPSGSVSKYAYSYDAAGRRISCAHSGSAFDTPDTYDYLYNARSELTNATAAVDSVYRYSYQFDDIGNREASSERGTNSVYTANSLNQYTAVDDFVPQFDDDGNQTLVKTATGIWHVTYNGENRQVRWEQIDQSEQSTNQTVLAMSYDRMGRRETKNGQRFVYNGYMQIADNRGNAYVWDPTEPVATRPLFWRHDGEAFFYTHDGNKNVSEVIAAGGVRAAHYEYAPLGALTVSCGGEGNADNPVPDHYSLLPVRCFNPWRFSSECADDDTSTLYYNYRHYEPVTGRWLSGDPIEESGGLNLFVFLQNASISHFDELGLGWTWKYGIPVFLYDQCCEGKNYDPTKECCIDNKKYSRQETVTGVSFYCHRTRWYYPMVQPIIRPFSPSQFMVDHCWFNVDDFRFGAYPNWRFEDGKSIRDESTMPSNYNATHEKSFWTSGGPVKLSPCEYDLERFKKCIRGKFYDTSFEWTLWNNCRDFVIDSVRECKKLSKR